MPDETDAPHDVLAAEEFGVPAPDPRLTPSAAHDVLAAEEFAVPAPDPRLTAAQARDVLAAEEFAMPAPDPRLRIVNQPLILPADPQDPRGATPAHDVLAAEEFALPGGAPELRSDASAQRAGALKAVVALGVVGLVLRLRRRGRP